MTQTPRMRRLAGRIQEIVAVTLRDQVKDPRVGMITITAARITPDLHDAIVFYTVLGDDADWAATSAALESAKGVLRSAVGQGTGVRFTPTLTFKPDKVPEVARHIDELLSQAKQADEQVARQAASAQYAGERDPYRIPEIPDAPEKA